MWNLIFFKYSKELSYNQCQINSVICCLTLLVKKLFVRNVFLKIFCSFLTGHTKHEVTSWSSFHSIFKYLNEKIPDPISKTDSKAEL